MEIGTYCVQVWALSLRHGPPAEKVRSKTLMCQIQSQIKFKAASRGEELCVAPLVEAMYCKQKVPG